MYKNDKSSKKEFFFPTFFVILMFILGILGLICFYGTKETIKSCTNEVKGIVDHEGYGFLKEKRHSVAGKYLNTGKNGKYWIEIYVNTDGIFTYEILYAGRSYGSEGDRLTIHYNPDNPDEYYIGDCKTLNQYGTAIFFQILSGIMLLISIITMIYYNVKEEKTENEKEKRREEKKKKEAERIKKTKERIDRNTKLFTKKYTNIHIRKHIQDCVAGSKMTLWIWLIGIALFSSSIGRTYIDMHTGKEIPFNNYSDDIDDTYYSLITDEKPIEVCRYNIYGGGYGKYYDLKVGNNHILAKKYGAQKQYPYRCL